MSVYSPATTLQQFEVTMLFALNPNDGCAYQPRRLKTLLWAGVVMAISTFPLHAQESLLRGSIDDNFNAIGGDFSANQSDLSGDSGFSQSDGNVRFYNADPDLTPVDNIRTSAIGPISPPDQESSTRENLPQPAEQGRQVNADEDPFAPIGIRAGSFILRPSLEQGIRATSNGSNGPNGSSAVLSETTLRVDARSDWSRHEANINASGTLSESISGENVSQPRMDIQSGLRLDITEQTAIRATGNYHLRRESASNPNSIIGALKRPIVQTIGGSLGAEHDTGLIFGSADARIQRNIYGNAKLASGGSLSQKDRDNTYASILLRSGFAISPALKPFVELELGKRKFDETIDRNGYERSGTQYALRGGLMFDRGEKFNGEIAAGYMRANFDDSRLSDISGPSISARINWSPLRGTDVNLFAQTVVDTSTSPGISGSLLYFASIDVTHRVRSDLSLTGRLDLDMRDNKDGSGHDYTIGAQIGATYWINRFMGIDARLRHEFLNSQVAWREYRSNSIYVGMKLQR